MSTDPEKRSGSSNAYKGFAASPHRSRGGVYSTLSEDAKGVFTSHSTTSLPPRYSPEAEELYSLYSASLMLRLESRMPTTSSQRRERSLLKSGAEDIKMRVPTGSPQRKCAKNPLSYNAEDPFLKRPIMESESPNLLDLKSC
jgi:hypothetical protein